MTPRQVKSPARKAQEIVDVAGRKLEKLLKFRANLLDAAAALDPEIQEAQARLDWALSSPDLVADVVDETGAP